MDVEYTGVTDAGSMDTGAAGGDCHAYGQAFLDVRFAD